MKRQQLKVSAIKLLYLVWFI